MKILSAYKHSWKTAALLCLLSSSTSVWSTKQEVLDLSHAIPIQSAICACTTIANSFWFYKYNKVYKLLVRTNETE